MKSKLESKRFSNVSSQLNWQIRQEQRRIRKQCSFFAFVGPASAFRPPRKNNESITPDAVGIVPIPGSAAKNLKRRSVPTLVGPA